MLAMRNNDPQNFCAWTPSITAEVVARVAACGVEPSAVLVYSGPKEWRRLSWPRSKDSQEKLLRGMLDAAAAKTLDKPLRLEWRVSKKNAVVCRVWTVAQPEILSHRVTTPREQVMSDDDGADNGQGNQGPVYKHKQVLNQNGRNEFDVRIAEIGQQTALTTRAQDTADANLALAAKIINSRDEQVSKREAAALQFVSQAVQHQLSFLGIMKEYGLGMAQTHAALGASQAQLVSQQQINELKNQLELLSRDPMSKMGDQLAPMVPALLARWAGMDDAALMNIPDEKLIAETERRAARANAVAEQAEREEQERAAKAQQASAGPPKA